MLKASPWVRLMPLFGAAAIVVLLVTAAMLWFIAGDSPAASDFIDALGTGVYGRLPILLVGLALLLVVLMMVAYIAARDYRRAAVPDPQGISR